ncbi:MAG TPA: HAMP domain-containing sensor histidine kinase [Kiritimatiellia bacterium]|mgnify:CR=1 FL=1|nr:HAMP domain-containing sensor histidine kinase [Kiritimatiellia bacterium]
MTDKIHYRASDDAMEVVCDILGHLAHDLNNLMTPVLACGQMLKDSMPETDPLYFCAEQITEAGEQCHDLARKLQVMGSKRKGQHRIDLNSVIENLVTETTPGLPSTCTLQTDLCPTPLTVTGDLNQCQTLIRELLSNAITFMPNGGTVRIASERSGDKVRIIVSDQGTGIQADHLPLIFMPYFSTQQGKRTKGFGLAMVYGMIKRYEGQIDVNTRPGEGTEFVVTLPLATA